MPTKNNYSLVSVIVITVIITLFVSYIGQHYLSFTPNNTQFSKINSTLDNEHSDIFKAIDHLYSVCDKHWKTEDKMYNEGKLKMPPNHINVSKDWETHRQEHIKLLDGIKQMKQGIITHIKEQDLQHFHWAK
jgi:hypothetical protein|tara:strand:+ start:176 stop:571 length:396 start_codon:yes stop_codon:yes gene_type:complete